MNGQMLGWKKQGRSSGLGLALLFHLLGALVIWFNMVVF